MTKLVINESRLKKLIDEKIKEWVEESISKNGKPLSFNKQLKLRRGWTSFDNPLSIAMSNKQLNEGLTRTYPAPQVKKWLIQYYGFEDWQIEIFELAGGYGFMIYVPSSEGNEGELTTAMDRMGYFLSRSSEEYNPDEGEVWGSFQFEPKFQPNETQTVKETCRTLYHATPFYNKEKIQQNGLCPKSKNTQFSYPSRVYFFTDKFSEAAIKHYISDLRRAESRKWLTDRTKGKYSLFKIDVSKLPENVELHYDVNLNGAVWTTSNIPPTIIDFVEDIQF
mgnify:CR=1 FL=1